MPIAVGVIADDLTGANATGVLLRKRGFRSFTLLDPAALEGGAPVGGSGGAPGGRGLCAGAAPGAPAGSDGGALLLQTESRGAPPEAAAAAVREAARLLRAHSPRLLAKRIDSTLRGNPGAETEAVLRVLGPDAIAVVVAAFPASGRATAGGRQYVYGVPLAETEARDDPLRPVTESEISAIFRQQTGLPVAWRPPGAPWPAGARIVICDAATDEEIEQLAEETARAPFLPVPVDPGPFTAALAARLGLPAAAPRPEAAPRQKAAHESGAAPRPEAPVPAAAPVPAEAPVPAPAPGAAALPRRVLVLSGSRTPQTKAQLDRLPLLRVNPQTDDPAVVAETLLRTPGAVAGARAGGPLFEGGAAATAAFLARVARRMLEANAAGALYTTGGDTTAAVCRALGAGGIELLGEVLPLAAYGRLCGGPFDGLPIVTKGGLVGGPDAAAACVAHLLANMTSKG